MIACRFIWSNSERCSGSLQSYRVAVVILNIIEVPELVGVLGNQLVPVLVLYL